MASIVELLFYQFLIKAFFLNLKPSVGRSLMMPKWLKLASLAQINYTDTLLTEADGFTWLKLQNLEFSHVWNKHTALYALLTAIKLNSVQ